MDAVLAFRGENTNSLAIKAGDARSAVQSVVHRAVKLRKIGRRETMQPVADLLGVRVGAFYDADLAIEELRAIGAKDQLRKLGVDLATAAPSEPIAIRPARAGDILISELGAVLRSLTDLQRKMAAPLFAQLVEKPETADELATAFANLLGGAGAQAEPLRISEGRRR